MRNLLLILTLGAACGVTAAREIYLYPALYATWGAFDDRSRFDEDFTSRELACYLTVSDGDRHFVSFAISDLYQSGPGWHYDQQFYLAGLRTRHYPYALLLHFGYMDGDLFFEDFDNSFIPPLTGHLYSAEAQRWFGRALAGLQAHTYRQATFNKIVAQSFSARGYLPLSARLGMELRPGFTWGSEGQRFEWLEANGYLILHRRLMLTVGGMTGEQLFDFDNDLFVLDNQRGTLQQRAFAKLKITPLRGIDIVGEYVAARYESYDVDYLVLGLSMRRLIAG